jgi:multiple sugar transport system permease protein
LITYSYKLGFVETKFDMAASVTVVLFVLLVAIAGLADRLSGGNAGAVAAVRLAPGS